jgi:hypothetical protein
MGYMKTLLTWIAVKVMRWYIQKIARSDYTRKTELLWSTLRDLERMPRQTPELRDLQRELRKELGVW